MCHPPPIKAVTAITKAAGAAITMAAAFSSPPEVEVEVEEGERAMMTSLTAITVGPPPAAAIMIVINGAAVGRTDLSPP